MDVKINNTPERQLQAYNEAKQFCDRYFNFKGDKRGGSYKAMSRVSELFVARLNNFAKILNLPNTDDLYFN